MIRPNKIITSALIILSFITTTFGQTQQNRVINANMFFAGAVFGDTVVHLAWEVNDPSIIQSIQVERSTDGIIFSEIASEEISKLPDIHLLDYPEGINYMNHILYSTEHSGNKRYIYNDVIKDQNFDIFKIKYRIRMVLFSGQEYLSQPLITGNETNMVNSDLEDHNHSDEIQHGPLKSGEKAACPSVGTPSPGYSPTSTVVTNYGTCCSWQERQYESGVIMVPCGGYSYAWCCNNVPGAGSCQSGYVWDPCCVHACTQYYSCSCHPWNCCALTMVTEWVVENSTNYPPISATPLVTNETCPGKNDGAIDLQLTNATSPVNYSWTGGLPNTNPVTGLQGGTYSVTVTDANNCQFTGSYYIAQGPGPIVTIGNYNPMCISAAPITLNSGTPYGGSYIGNGVTGSNFDPVLAGQGTHDIIYIYADINGCLGYDTTQITVNPLPVINFNPLTPRCIDAGQYTLTEATPVGGTYSGTGVSGGVFNPQVAGAGNHTITYTYTDSNSCTNYASEVFTVYSLPVVTMSALPPVCVDVAPYTITSGGPAGGTYIGNGITGDIFDPSSAGAGNHTIEYTYMDANGCDDTASTVITVNPMPVVSFSPLAEVCTNTPPFALAQATPSGGTYYGTGVSNNIFDPAAAGVGTHTITYIFINSGQCADTGSQDILVKPVPTSDFTVTPSILCSLNDSIYVEYTGTANDTANYFWDFNTGTANPGIGDGPHWVEWSSTGQYNLILIVTENGCTSLPTTLNVMVSDIQTTTNVVNNVSCFQGNDGSVSVTAINGITPYTYSWSTSPVQTSSTATSLTVGTYYVTVSDPSGCLLYDTVSITEPPLLTASVVNTTIVSCFGGADGTAVVAADGGTPAYNYTWPVAGNVDSIIGLSAGSYNVTVTDDKGCITTAPFTITQQPEILISLYPANESCPDDCNGYIFAIVNGGVPPYEYNWSENAPDSSGIEGLCADDYYLSITDSNGCQKISSSVTVSTNTYITATSIVDPAIAFYPATIDFTYIGENGETFYWDFGDGETSYEESPSHLYTIEGEYDVTVTVNTGYPDYCQDIFTLKVIIKEPSMLTVPNIFTPNGDGVNDFFFAVSKGLETEEMKIFNRWGKLMREWNYVNGNWDGRKADGTKASDGVYYWVIHARGFDGVVYDSQGSVTLMR